MNKGFFKLGVLFTVLALAFVAGVVAFTHPTVQSVFATQQQEEPVNDGCDHSCPVVHYEWTEKSCPAGYSPWIGDWCEKNGQQFDLKPMVVTNHSADVAYEKSNDPNKCHRPSDATLKDVYGMSNSAKNDFKDEHPQFMDSIDVVPDGYDYNEETGVCTPPVEEPKDYCDTVDGVQPEDYDCPAPEEPTCPEGTHEVPQEPTRLIVVDEYPQEEELVCEPDEPKEPEQPGNPPTFAGSSTEAPVCSDGSTVNVPANPHVWRAGEKATVNFFITEGDVADVVYKEVNAPDWQHAVSNLKPNADKFVSAEIGGLDPNLGYTFGVRQRIGCGGGQTITAVIIDGPEPQLFQFSYWEVK